VGETLAFSSVRHKGKYSICLYKVSRAVKKLQHAGLGLADPRTAMSNPRAAYGPVEGFVRPSLVFAVVSVLHTDNLSLFEYSWI